MVGLQVLVLAIGVRVPVPEQIYTLQICQNRVHYLSVNIKFDGSSVVEQLAVKWSHGVIHMH